MSLIHERESDIYGTHFSKENVCAEGEFGVREGSEESVDGGLGNGSRSLEVVGQVVSVGWFGR